VGGVLEGEGTLELSCTNLELRESTPLGIEVYQLYGRLSGTSGIGSLYLGTTVEITDLTVEDETCQTEIERVAVVALRILALIL
jgi:hypothetical protein